MLVKKIRQPHLFDFQIALGVIWACLTMVGCVSQEVVRKADWETNFTDLHFANQRQGWIVGLNGLILHTMDGGQTWIQQESGVKKDLKSVCFTNNRYGWAVGYDGIIISTDDGGLTLADTGG